MARSGTATSGSGALTSRTALALLGLFALVAGIIWFLNGADGGAAVTATVAPTSAGAAAPSSGLSPGAASGTSSRSSRSPSASTPPSLSPSAGLRAKSDHVLAVLDATGKPPPGYVGGRQFMNDERGDTTALPRRDRAGRALTYREYDVNPRRPDVNRGPQRLVVGSDGSAYMTGDHYVTWERIR